MLLFPANPPARRNRPAAFSLVEVMVALGIFVVAGMGVIQVLGVINNNATVDRAMSAARLLVGAKIAKAQTDTWTPTNNVVPMGCVAPTEAAPYDEAHQDPNDFLDFGRPVLTAPNAATYKPYFDLYSPAAGQSAAAQAYAASYPVTLVNTATSSASNVITGTMHQAVQPFEAASKTVLVTYTLSFSFRGKPYQFSQSIVRAPDQI